MRFIVSSYDISGEPYGGILGVKATTVGFSQLAAALLAAHHFNTRNASIVPEIASLPDTCTAVLDISKAVNAIRFHWTGIHTLALEGMPPCAMVGPFDDQTATDLAVMAQAHHVPMVTTRSSDINVVSDVK